METVIIIGAGIGGLAAALALERAGVDVEVHERAPELTEVGAGLALWPNGLRALDAIGLGAAVRALGGPDVCATMRAPDGRVLQRIDTRTVRARHGDPMITVHRAELLHVLLEAFGRDRVWAGRELAGIEQTGDVVHAVFCDGTRVRGAGLIGADGVHSVVRTHLPGSPPARYRGDTSWRAVLAAGEVPVPLDEAFETVGRGLRFGATPMSNGRVQWFAGAVRPEGERDGEDVRGELVRLFAGWHDPVPALIAATRGPVIRTDIHDMPRCRVMAHGRVALLGDAAHAMGPDVGQGAGLALEDAEALGHGVAGNRDVPAALEAYERARRRRVRRVQRLVGNIGALARMEHPRLERLRDGLSAAAPRGALVWQLDQLVGRPPAVVPGRRAAAVPCGDSVTHGRSAGQTGRPALPGGTARDPE